MTRRFQFSLRALFGLLVIVSLPCGVAAYFRYQLADYYLAAEPIERATGCRILASGDGMGMMAGRYGINKLDFTDTSVDDAVVRDLLPHLKRLPNLVCFDINRTPITDDGLETLCQLKQLHSLGLVGTRVTPTGVQQARRKLPACQIYGP